MEKSRQWPVVPVSPAHSAAMEWDSESVQSEDLFKQPENPERESKPVQLPSTPQTQGGVRAHEFVSKTVRVHCGWRFCWSFLCASAHCDPKAKGSQLISTFSFFKLPLRR